MYLFFYMHNQYLNHTATAKHQHITLNPINEVLSRHK